MDFKELILADFSKENFSLSYDKTSGSKEHDWNKVDSYIREFVKRLNKNKNISTLYCCEGHKEKDSAYLFFTVNSKGWDIFYSKVVPELSHSLTFIDDSSLNIPFNISTTTYNTKGISVQCVFRYECWEFYKSKFWTAMEKTFLKHFN